MIKYLFFILIMLLSGCTTDFSGLEKPEESVYIRFSSCADLKVDIEETTRSGYVTPGQSVGILGVATDEANMDYTTLEGLHVDFLRKWMANDVYYYHSANGVIARDDEQCPLFPIDKGSAIVAYAYMPHTDRVVYGEDDCYIPIDLMADSASTDWRYSGKTAMSKAAYREKGTFALDSFKHVMTRIDLVLHSNVNKTNKSARILEIDLGICNHGQGKLSLGNGKLTMDTASCVTDSVYRLLRRPDHEFSLYDDLKDSIHIERYYLLPYTEIHDIRIVSLWNNADTIIYEHVIAGSGQWNSNNLHAGKRSTINVKSIKYINKEE